MTEPMRRIEAFVARVHRRLNQRRLHYAAAWTSAGVGGALAFLALAFVAMGTTVPIVLYPAAVIAGALVGTTAWAWRRVSHERAAQFADQHFGLADGLAAAQRFAREGRRGGFYTLQARWAARAVARLHADTVRPRPQKRVWCAAALAVALAAGLGFVPPSRAVRERRALEEELQQQTETLNEQVQQYVDELLQGAEEEELELLRPDELRQWVAELGKQKDVQEAMRQYARVEQKLAEASRKLNRARDERLLSEAARELKKDASHKHLGEQLAQKKYRDAAEAMQKLQHHTRDKLDTARTRTDQLRSASSRMAHAARRSGQRNGDNRHRGQPQDRDAQAKPPEQDGTVADLDKLEQANPVELSDQIEELDEAARECDKRLCECESSCRKCGSCSAQQRRALNKAGQSANRRLAALTRSLKRLDAARRAQRQLDTLRRKLGQCQSCVAGQCANPFLAPGGKHAGVGSDLSTNEDFTREDGVPTALTGTPGMGPSLVTVESADEGTGVSGRNATGRQIEFARQVESFVKREDIPAPLKSGVKRYFTTIHEDKELP